MEKNLIVFDVSSYRISASSLGLLEPGKKNRLEGDHVVVGQRQRFKPDDDDDDNDDDDVVGKGP